MGRVREETAYMARLQARSVVVRADMLMMCIHTRAREDGDDVHTRARARMVMWESVYVGYI